VLFDEGANCANQVVTLGLSDRVQALDDPTVIVAGRFERTVGVETKLIKPLFESFSNNVVCCMNIRTRQGGKIRDSAYCTRT